MEQSLFISFNDYLKKKFGYRIFKVSIDGGFTCPNRDGQKGFGGCLFCDETGSSSRTNPQKLSMQEQILNNIKVRKSRRFRAKKFIAYFQSYTNTYAPASTLKKRYDEAISSHPDIIGLSIATRSDCLDEEKINLIASYKAKLPFVSVELGLQSIHNKTLHLLNRQETYEDFLKAFALIKKYQLEHCVHIILGLPGENEMDEIQTAKTLASLGVEGVKIHLLVAMKNTPLAEMYQKGLWQPLSFEEFIKRAVAFIEKLPSNCIIHRISGNGHPMHIEVPQWMRFRRKEILPAIKLAMERSTKMKNCSGSAQNCYFNAS